MLAGLLALARAVVELAETEGAGAARGSIRTVSARRVLERRQRFFALG
jgi:hypothetical protein